MKKLNVLLVVGIILFSFASCSEEQIVEESPSYNIDLSIVNQTDWKMADEIMDLVNAHRASIGKDAIQLDQTYASAYATEHTNYMINKFAVSHDNFQVRSAALKSRGATSVAENVAYGYNTAEDVLAAWLLSPSHKAIIEGPYKFSGLGVSKASNGQYFFTQLFYKN